jgi:hypothetical protein
MLPSFILLNMSQSENGNVATFWRPDSAEGRALVLSELEAILSSYHFRGSKRYPALLKYIVEAALEERSCDLKERTLGIEVFGREPDYDTNIDPVVRISAGEVRKRIAQYYHENGHGARVQIELPLGSYVPEFLLRAPDSSEAQARPESKEGAVPETSARSLWRRTSIMLLGLLAVFIAGALIARHLLQSAREQGDQALHGLWDPVLQSTKPVIIVLGTTHPENMPPESENTTLNDNVRRPYHHVSVSIALALADIAGVLHQQGRGYEAKEAPETSLTDIRSRSVILVGASNNDWTMRLTQPLRIHFFFGPDGMGRIEDVTNPRQTDWELDNTKPYSSLTADYAIVARFRDPTVEETVMVIAGIGPWGTEAAGEFVQSPQALEQLAKMMPSGWEHKNIEVVLKSNVIGGQPGPPIIMSGISW